MAARLVYSKRALSDIDVLLSFIAADGEIAAAEFGDALLKHIDLLSGFPKLGPRFGDGDVRVLVHTPVCVYYVYFELMNSVEILHVRHSAPIPPTF